MQRLNQSTEVATFMFIGSRCRLPPSHPHYVTALDYFRWNYSPCLSTCTVVGLWPGVATGWPSGTRALHLTGEEAMPSPCRATIVSTSSDSWPQQSSRWSKAAPAETMAFRLLEWPRTALSVSSLVLMTALCAR